MIVANAAERFGALPCGRGAHTRGIGMRENRAYNSHRAPKWVIITTRLQGNSLRKKKDAHAIANTNTRRGSAPASDRTRGRRAGCGEVRGTGPAVGGLLSDKPRSGGGSGAAALAYRTMARIVQSCSGDVRNDASLSNYSLFGRAR